MDKGQLSFKEMCAQFEVTPRTLRYYEYIELLQPERDGRSRFYNSRDVARMTLIMRGRRFGFSLEELRQWLMIYDKEGNEAQMQAWVPIAQGKLVELQKQQKEISEAVLDLSEMIDSVSSDLNQS
ncbi:MerR family DNA-binding transcriptional regulator [Planktomarina sp.]|nr:MerR family DNA-binding transcriptional regulator [Planktomarina sp.]